MSRMNSIGVLVLLGSLGIALGSNCQNLSGLWRNQLGSNMTIIHRTSNSITGEYSTAVESKFRAAVVASNITGVYKTVDDGGLLSFTVLFNRGKSLTTWVGQCIVCEGQEVLFTSWVLRAYNLKRSDRWMSTRINQDTFIRVPGYENVPHHLRVMGPLPQAERSSTCEKNIKAGTRGKWIADTGDVIDFDDCYTSGLLSGSNHNSVLAGRSEGGEPFTALGFVSASEDTVKGWTGHIYEGSVERKLQTSWLNHTFSNSCNNPRELLRYGMANYTFDTSYDDLPSNTVWQSLLHYVDAVES